jgi:hypothetical protein
VGRWPRMRALFLSRLGDLSSGAATSSAAVAGTSGGRDGELGRSMASSDRGGDDLSSTV